MDALAMYGKVTEQGQDGLIMGHASLVKRIAYHLSARLPSSVLLDDLIQAGMLGLIDAARQFDATKGASFETYANIRIRGHMLDEVRRNDWVPRSVYRNARTIAEAVRQIEHRLGREATDKEIAAELGMQLDDYFDILKDTAGTQVYNYEDSGLNEESLIGVGNTPLEEPQQAVLHQEMMGRLVTVIDGLPEREKLVLSLYYEQDLNLKEIGQVIGVGESRVSQLISQAIVRAQARLME